MSNAIAEARRVLSDPELVLASHEWRQLVANMLRWFEAPQLCPQCALTRAERLSYAHGCPMVTPSLGCPFYDAPRPTKSHGTPLR